jgi:hypothetical protein
MRPHYWFHHHVVLTRGDEVVVFCRARWPRGRRRIFVSSDARTAVPTWRELTLDEFREYSGLPGAPRAGGCPDHDRI